MTPTSVLFCCDHNSIRSPMAEGLMKRECGTDIYIQSAGVRSDMEIDGFAVAVCEELGVELDRHQSRSFEEMEKGGETISSYDLVVALSQHAYERAQEMSRYAHIEIEYWPIFDPSATEGKRDVKLAAYRQARDEILERIQARFAAEAEA